MSRILIVDDEAAIRALLRAYLTAEGFAVEEADSGATALEVALGEDPPLLVLLDLGLPDLDGLEVLAKIREATEMFVIVVTARAEEVDKLAGLTVGADDYITKPFSPREVVARVRTVLRRVRHSGPDAVLRFPGLTINPARREVVVDGEQVTLTALDFDLLRVLAESPGRVYSRAQLLEKVWGYDFYGDERVVDVHVRTMRNALGDDALQPKFIGTVRGVGYRFLPERAS